MRIPALFIFILAFALAGCGTPGAPLPPSLGIPKPVENLRAARKGDRLRLPWWAPTEPPEGKVVRNPGKMRVSRTVAGSAAQLAELPLPPAINDQQPPAPTTKDSLASLLQAPPSD